MTLYVLSYNNYYNRMVKFNEKIEQYPNPIFYHENINFNPNDGIDTQHLVGNSTYDGKGDYVIITDQRRKPSQVGVLWEETIISRWFIIEAVRTRGGQYLLTLHRDVIADYYNVIKYSPIFVEKANLTYNNPLVFNEEDMTVNQIKTKDTLIKDKSDCAWLVGYYDRNKLSEMNGTVPTNSIIPGAIQLNEDIENWKFYDYSNLAETQQTFLGQPESEEFVIRTVGRLGDNSYTTEVRFFIDSTSSSVSSDDFSWSTRPSLSTSVYGDNLKKAKNNIATVLEENPYILSNMNLYAGNYADITTKAEWDEFNNFKGATVRDAQGRYFQVDVIDTSDEESKYVDVPSGNLFNVMSDLVSNLDSDLVWGTPDTRSFMIRVEAKKYTISLVELSLKGTRYNFQAGIVDTLDAPWNIFAMPYNVDSNLTIKDTVNNKELDTIDNDVYLNAIMAMQVQHPGIVYDVQLLPYCPIPGIISDVGEITVYDASEFSTIVTGEQNEIVGYIFHCPMSNFSSTIDRSEYIIPGSRNAITQKLNNLCDKYRLAAPNYSSFFDFSVEKNGGIQWYDIDCNYKPFTPYIHINPNFSGLYGYDDNSPRGLVLGGDFSLSQVIDQWQQYQVQNKNFQAIFDRQIQNMEVTNKYQRKMDIVGAITGTVQGAISGAFLGGAMTGGTTGSKIAGGVGGTAASAIGGVADYRIKERLRNEAIDYTKDNFGYQLGNIQALPQTISKVSAFNNNNKIFPVLEYYTCTFEEKLALANKIAYNGMSVGVIGTLSEYESNTWANLKLVNKNNGNERKVSSMNYFKGQLIRYLENEEDFHLVQVIADELNKGVYLQ